MDSLDDRVTSLSEMVSHAGVSTVEALRNLGLDVIGTPDGCICYIEDAPDAIPLSGTEYAWFGMPKLIYLPSSTDIKPLPNGQFLVHCDKYQALGDFYYKEGTTGYAVAELNTAIGELCYHFYRPIEKLLDSLEAKLKQ